MTLGRSLVAPILLLASLGFGQGQDPGSAFSVNSPGTCGTGDNAIVTSQDVFGQAGGFACMRTYIFPQFAVGNGWTTQITGFLPTQPFTTGLANGSGFPSFILNITPGSGAKATLGNNAPVPFSTANGGCVGFWVQGDQSTLPYSYQVLGDIGSGQADQGDFPGLGAVKGCGSITKDALLAGSAQGPLQMQIFAPNQMTINQATLQLSYFYQDQTFSWQVTVNPVDINGAKAKWTAPLYQGQNDGNSYVTAFTVVNAAKVAQSATISLRNKDGNGVGTPFVTPMLAPGCGCDQLNQSAVGEFYAGTVPNLFPGIGDQIGSIEFLGNSGPILVLVLRTVNNSLGSVPAK